MTTYITTVKNHPITFDESLNFQDDIIFNDDEVEFVCSDDDTTSGQGNPFIRYTLA